MRIIFFGTPPFAAHILGYLIEQGHSVVAIVTRPDKPRGRSQQLLPSAVKALATEKWPEIPIFQPAKASTDAFAKALKDLNPEVFVVVAYGEIIKENLLQVPSKMCVNVHGSLLPKYRGAAPIQRAIMAGEKETGITIIEMALQMDAGPILGMEKIEISEETNFEELRDNLCTLSCHLLQNVLEKIENGTVQKIIQNQTEATFAPKITFDDRVIDWEKSAEEVHDQIRALSPDPGALCTVEIKGQKKSLSIKRAKKILTLSGNAGETLSYKKNEWIIGCGTGAISLLEVQLEGKKSMPIDEFIRGNPNPLAVKLKNFE